MWQLSREASGGYALVRVADEESFRRSAQLETPDPTPEQEQDASEREALGLSIKPKALLMREAARYFATLGAVTVDEVSTLLPQIKSAGKTSNKAPRVASWENLTSLVGPRAEFARMHFKAGATARLASLRNNIKFRLAYRLLPVITGLPKDQQGLLIRAAKGDAKAMEYVNLHMPRQLAATNSIFKAHAAGRLAFGPMPDKGMDKDCSYCHGAGCVPKNGGKCASCGEMNAKNDKVASPYEYGVDTYNDGDDFPGMSDEPSNELQDCPSCGDSKSLVPKYPGDEFDCINCGVHLWTDPDKPGTLYNADEEVVGQFPVKTSQQMKAERTERVASFKRMAAKDQRVAMADPASPFFNPSALSDAQFDAVWNKLAQYEWGVDTYNDGGDGYWEDHYKGRDEEPGPEDEPLDDDGNPEPKMARSHLARLPRRAVDEAAKRYWKTYFGPYGDTWVSDVRKRLKADLLRASLKNAVDDSAVDYYADYYGEYGKELTEEKARDIKKKAGVQDELPPGVVADQPFRDDNGNWTMWSLKNDQYRQYWYDEEKADWDDKPSPGHMGGGGGERPSSYETDHLRAQKDAPPAPAAPPAEDPFAGDIDMEEKIGSVRVAVVKKANGLFLVRSGKAPQRHPDLKMARSAFGKEIQKILG